MPDSIWTIQFWKNTGELVLRGAAIGAGSAMGGSLVDAWHLDWRTISGFALSGGFMSLVASLGLNKVGQKGSPLVTGHGWNPVDPLGD